MTDHESEAGSHPTKPSPILPQKYLGFVAGVFSGIAKLTVGHPFDTIKVRLQTAKTGQFSSTIDCVAKSIKNEGLRSLYKGATPPLLGWMVMDSVMLGSLQNYRRLLKEHVYPNEPELPLIGKCAAGAFAGWTVSFIAGPVELIKSRLQVQYDAKTKLYTGPINCASIILKQRGITGIYKGLLSTMIFRTNFIFWWGSYDIFTKWFEKNTSLPTAAINFWAGGLSATVFWCTSFPSDVIKQQIMTDSITKPKYPSYIDAAKAVYQNYGWKGYWRGFLPCILRSFPANAAALATFEAVMRYLH